MSKKKAKPPKPKDDAAAIQHALMGRLQLDVDTLNRTAAVLLQRVAWCEEQTAQIRGRLNVIENGRPLWRLRNLLCFWRRR